MNSKHNTSNACNHITRQHFSCMGISKKSFFVICMYLIVVALGVVAGFVPRMLHNRELANENRNVATMAVSIVTPLAGQTTLGLPLPAEIKPWVEASIYTRTNGYLVKRYVDIGSEVKEGQLLAEIDTPELDQQHTIAKGLLVQAETAAELARISAIRRTALVKQAAVSVQENDEKQADLKLKAAAVDSARAEVRRLAALLSFNRLTAPFAGTVTVRNVDLGDLVGSAGGKELFHLAQTDRLRVFVQAPQTIARSIHPGQAAEMAIAEIPGKIFSATVIRTAGAMSADSRTLLVELEVDNSKHEILAGSFAQLRFKDLKVDAAPTLPTNAIIFRSGGPQIGVVLPEGKVELRAVRLGRDFGQKIEILAGVDLGDRIVINPPESLKNEDIVLAKPVDNQRNKASGEK